MKAVRIHAFGPTVEGLRYDTDVPVPEPAEGEVLIRMEAASLNRADLGVRSGRTRVDAPLPFVPGRELSGTVERLGPGTQGVQPGQRVAAHPWLGAYAEYAVCPQAYVRPVPDGVDAAKAAAMPTTYLTAQFAFEAAKLAPNDRVLVQAGGSGVGTAAIQLARQMGARVLTTAGTDEKCRLLHNMGADETINYQTRDFVQEVMRVTGGRGVDVVLEMVGGEVYSKSLETLASGGRLVSIGGAGGPIPENPPPLEGGRTAFRFSISSHLQQQPETFARLDPLLEQVRNGTLKVIVDKQFPLSQAREAQQYLEGREHFGKIVLTP